MSRRWTKQVRAACATLGLSALVFAQPDQVAGQEEAAVDSIVEAPAGLPIFATLGFVHGQRRDGCILCEHPADDSGFGAHLSVGKYLAHGVGVGVDASAWRRVRPAGFELAPEEGAEAAPANLTNMLSNASIVFSIERWHAYVRAGGGLAWGSQDWVEEPPEDEEGGEPTIVSMSGMGIGYTLGGGLTLPLHPMVSLAFFANYNVGFYDLSSPSGSVFRDGSHKIVEVGVGVSLR